MNEWWRWWNMYLTYVGKYRKNTHVQLRIPHDFDWLLAMASYSWSLLGSIANAKSLPLCGDGSLDDLLPGWWTGWCKPKLLGYSSHIIPLESGHSLLGAVRFVESNILRHTTMTCLRVIIGRVAPQKKTMHQLQAVESIESIHQNQCILQSRPMSSQHQTTDSLQASRPNHAWHTEHAAAVHPSYLVPPVVFMDFGVNFPHHAISPT